MQPAAEIVRAIASLFQSSGYHVTGVVRDPAANAQYLFFVDDGQFKDSDGIELPTAVHVAATNGEVTFDGLLAGELEQLLARTR